MTAPFRPSPNGQQGYPGQQQQQPQAPQQQQTWQQPPQPQFQPPPQPQVPATQNIMPEPAYSFPAPQFQPPPQQQPQGQPQFQPQQPQYQQPPQQPPQQQRPQQAPAQQVQMDQQGRLTGPGIPQELQGRTLQEALGMYGMMRSYASQNLAQQQPQQRQPQQQPAPQQPQIPARAPATNFFSDPEGAIERVLERRLAPMLAPVLEQTAQTQIEQARTTVAQLYPREFAQYEGEIYQRLQGLPAQTLANPEAWRIALHQVVGEQALSGRQPQQQSAPQQSGRPVMPWEQQQQSQQNLPWQPATTPSFFTESPSAHTQAGLDPNGQTGVQLSEQQREIARRFGLSEQQYVQGMGVRY